MAPGGERRERRHGCARRKADRGGFRQPEQVDEPGSRDLFRDRRGGPDRIKPRVLIPGACQPVRRQRRGQGAADHEPEVARTGAGDQARVSDRGEMVDDLAGGLSALGKLAAHRCDELVVRRGRSNRPCIEPFEVVGGEIRGLVKEGAAIGHRGTSAVRNRSIVRTRPEEAPWTDVEGRSWNDPGGQTGVVRIGNRVRYGVTPNPARNSRSSGWSRR